MKNKKLLFPLLMAIVMMAMSPTKMWADNDVNVLIGGADDAAIAANDGDAISPFCGNSNYVMTITLYTPDQIGVSGKINSIAYYVKNSSELTGQKVKIYMTMVDATLTRLLKGYNHTIVGFKQVYSRDNLTLGSTEGWETFKLDEPFSYDNTKNLLVAVTVDRSSGTKSGDLKYAYSARPNYATIYRAHDVHTTYCDVTSWSDSKNNYMVNGQNAQACMKMNITACSHSFPDVSEEPATCVKASMSTCTKCGLLLSDGKTPATGHDYNSDTHKCNKCTVYDPTYVSFNGTDGSCDWAIYNHTDTRYADGEMVIRPTSGDAGTLGNRADDIKPNWYSQYSKIKKVRFEGNITAPNLWYMFYYCENLLEVDFTNLTTTNATSTKKCSHVALNLLRSNGQT